MRYSTSRRHPLLTGVFCRSVLVVLTGLALSSAADAQSYVADAKTQITAQYPSPATVYQSDGEQAGYDPNKTVTSTTDFGTTGGTRGVQLAYGYAKPGSLGIVAHGQSVPYSPDGPFASDVYVFASAYTVDMFQVPTTAPGPVTIHFSLIANADANFSYSPVFDDGHYGGLGGDSGLEVHYAASLQVGINGGAPQEIFWDVQKSGDTFVTTSTPQPFDVTARPGDFLRVYTEGQGWGTAYKTNQYFNADLSHTVHTYADVLTPGVTLITASGHDYSTPAPEPSQFAALGLGALGLGGLALRARRRA